ncbi:hypothetical protein [Nonomuraea rubra]|uniref:hypothetical protein n=1 Tax=Nonomuraea rubra TaxID=46180 RepID=UPI0033C0A895
MVVVFLLELLFNALLLFSVIVTMAVLWPGPPSPPTTPPDDDPAQRPAFPSQP